MPCDEVYLCDKCHDSYGVKAVDHFWCCARCAAEYLSLIALEGVGIRRPEPVQLRGQQYLKLIALQESKR